jgi:hypothetical protein
MTPEMDLLGNKKLDWFFTQWVYGNEIPRYRLDYKLAPHEDNSILLTAKLTQSGVSDGFLMRVPVYLDFDGNVIRLGSVAIQGNKTSQDFQVKLPKRPKRVMINTMQDVLAAQSESKEMQ